MKPVTVAEPTGLGAVVTDDIGRIWVRTADDTKPWYWAGLFLDWQRLTEPEILSEGHDPDCHILAQRQVAAIQFPATDAHDCDRCGGAGFLILDRVARATGELIDVECPRCRGTGTVR